MSGRLPYDPRPWRIRRDSALGNSSMRDTLQRVAGRLSKAKSTAYGDYQIADKWRLAGVAAKRRAISQIDELVGQVIGEIERHGGKVHRARDAAEAVRCVVEVAQKNGVKLVVKSKSMVTEEIELNKGLEDAGVQVVETDLGEYIIQLAHEKPSHILAPAIHRNRGQVKELFDVEADRQGMAHLANADIEQLTQFARQQLRQKFLSADMGVTGGNFLVAETGTIVLITNEGNADMVTSLPPLLVSIVGIEKIVGTWDDLGYLLQQPALSGVGQRLSSYTTFVSGPRDKSAMDGPDQWHVVLLDNGRRNLVGTPEESILSCIRCGACLNVCPVFRQIGGHAYGSVYPGPIGIVVSANLDPSMPSFLDLASQACSMCYACTEVCPMDIPLADEILTLRNHRVKTMAEPLLVRRTYETWGRLWSTKAGYQKTIRIARLGQRFLIQKKKLRWAPGLFGGWLKTRDMPLIPPETFREWWAKTHGE